MVAPLPGRHDALRSLQPLGPVALTAIPRGAPKKVTTVTVALAAAPSVWPSSSSVHNRARAWRRASDASQVAKPSILVAGTPLTATPVMACWP